jgi:hypothetical protein
MKKRTVVNKKDWIIIRLLVLSLDKGLYDEPDVMKSVLYMSKKYSLDAIGHCADLIRVEHGL